MLIGDFVSSIKFVSGKINQGPDVQFYFTVYCPKNPIKLLCCIGVSITLIFTTCP
jgi:hypothetical protein